MNVRVQSAAIAAAVVALDRVTKWFIGAHLDAWDVHPVIPGFFNIVHTENPGAAFSMLADSSFAWRRLLLIGVSAAVMVIIGIMLWRAPRPGTVAAASEDPLSQAGLALVFGGAFGNLWDRLFTGTVTDFLQFFFGSYEFPSFNVADSAITIGAGLLLLNLLKPRRSQAQA